MRLIPTIPVFLSGFNGGLFPEREIIHHEDPDPDKEADAEGR
jgi:hypothetical protein